jgi:hypothetical protein
VLVGAIALTFHLIVDIPRGNLELASLYTFAYLVVLFLALFKKLPFRVRTIGFLLVIYILSLAATLTDGIAGNGRIWFLGLTVLSGILIGLNSAIQALVLSLLTYLTIGGLMVGGILKTPQASSLPSAGIFMDWVNTSVVYVLAAVTIIISLSVLIRDLNASLEKEHRLQDELTKDQEELDKRADELNRRLIQIRTAAEISRSISAVTEPSVLLQRVVDLVRERFDLYYVGVFLNDDREEYAVLKAGTGEVGQQMIAEGHKLPIGGSSMIGRTIANPQPRIALETDDETVR